MSSVPEPIPLEPFVSARWSSRDDKSVFKVVVTTLRVDCVFEICTVLVELLSSVFMWYQYDR
jgi:hypothetical protein